MKIVCANCNGVFEVDEVRLAKPPKTPWPTTPAGDKQIFDNQVQGADHKPCPQCGNKALRPVG